MADVLISYDIENNHQKMKDRLKASPYNYEDKVKVGPSLIQLPNTTLWKSDCTSTEGKSDIEFVAMALGIKLEKAIAVEFVNLEGMANIN